MKIQATCSFCGETFYREKKNIIKRLEGGYNVYCSYVCCGKASTKDMVELTCCRCGIVFYRKPSKSIRYSTKNVYCSHTCANLSVNETKKKHDAYSTYRQRAILEYGCKCNFCDYSVESVLEVHHIDENRRNNKIENLVVVCPNHHKELAYGIIKLGR